MIQMEVAHQHQIHNFVQRLAPILFLQTVEVRKFLSVIIAHMQPTVENDSLVPNLHQNAAPAHILPSS